jgi:hypothetical protein
MTFLEYVCESLLGPPNDAKDGMTFWDCPECGREGQHFHTRPVSKRFPKQRVGCFACPAWGDAADVVKMHVLGLSTFEQARAAKHTPESSGLLRELRDEWKELLPDTAETGISSSPGNRETARTRVRPTVPQDEFEILHAVYHKLTEQDRHLMKHCLRVADRHDCDLTYLARHIKQWDNHVKASREEAEWIEQELLSDEERWRFKEAHRARIREEMEMYGETREQRKYRQRRNGRRRADADPDGWYGG